ncbi:hypothetical protein BBK14_31960 [Parafrankia soli]|uniref:Uncharacterized protein n=1 Tax=Parafrankia soli TaxID=2599596 RepID=A0A1S1R9D1_9ACTN|nr:hypothetical protein BBK14_31960 [Parafrankia soli]
MAHRRARADEVLAVDPARGHPAAAPGPDGEDPLAGRTRLPRAQDRPGTRAFRGPHLPRVPAPPHPGLGRAGILHSGAAVPASGGHGLTLYQVVAELQVLLACWVGWCPTCRQPLPPLRHIDLAPT